MIRQMLHRVIYGMFCSNPKNIFSVEVFMRSLALVKELPTGFDQLCASEHLDEENPRMFWQLLTMLTIIRKMEKVDPNIFGKHDVAESGVCAICLENLSEKGRDCLWYQLEPCRHWLCAPCGEMYINGQGNAACWCRCEIVVAVPAFAV